MSTRAIGDTAAARQAEEVVLINPTTGAQYVAGSAASGAALDATGAEKAPVYLEKGFQRITALSSAASLTVPSGTRYAVIQAEAQAVRWRSDGTNPTASVGMSIPAGGELTYDGDLSAIKFIEAAASAVLVVSYYA